MNWIDLLIILTVGLFALDGIKRGFLIQVFNILGFLTALLAALAFYPYTAQIFTNIFKMSQVVANPIGFLFNWIIAESIFFALFTNFYTKYATKLHHYKINKFLGILPAAANAALFLAFILLFIVSLPISAELKKDVLASRLGSPLIDKATALEKPFNNIFGPITKQSLTFLTVKPEEKGSIDLKFTQDKLTDDRESAQKMFELVNIERQKVGTERLVWDERLAKVGLAHSKDMFTRGYFSHFSPEGKDVGDRLQEANINYTFAGENLALAPDVDRAHSGLMNSPGHKRNILDPAFSKIGIGAVDGGIYGKMFTQVFTQ